MTPLNMAREGEKVRVLKISGGRGFVQHLTEMGLYPGVVIEVISDGRRGPFIIGVGGLRLGIGFGMAKSIFVEQLG
ncbi:MAG TPA: FeoA family protein [Syntrophorhabdaceae bacterium]|nr:FeoA family protein [Syntrophorhabdaceae bacterium]HPU29478.1 FeoA family protein [Syntrophorhabdaceae bacterium]